MLIVCYSARLNQGIKVIAALIKKPIKRQYSATNSMNTPNSSSSHRSREASQAAYRAAQFETSAASLTQLPLDEGLEVAFAGRSNAGKSSAINKITSQKSLARTSKTPGRTQLINFFRLDDQRRLVDLPGYGYAKVSEDIKLRWQQTMEQYLVNRQSLQGLILLMDVRHPLKEVDQQLLSWCQHVGMPVHVLLTKADKLKRGQAQNTLLKVRQVLKESFPAGQATVQLFSALKGTGLEEIFRVLDQWLYSEAKQG